MINQSRNKVHRNCVNVIVPVYNVSMYLKKCVDSILEQDFSDFYITLIDDCSTDDSGSICDEFEKLYPDRITVIHNDKNEGLSFSRNAGILSSDSEWIVFVDSDDYVSNHFLSNLYNAQIQYGCDMVVSPITKVYMDGNETTSIEKEKLFDPIVLDKNDALIELLYEKSFGGYAVSKLIKTETLISHLFPVGKLFEDSYIMYELFVSCDNVVCIPNPGYYYLQRIGSIQRSTFTERHYDLIYACDGIINYLIRNNYPNNIVSAAYYKLIKASYITCIHALESNHYSEAYAVCKEYMEKYKQYTLPIDRMTFKESLVFKTLVISKGAFFALYKINQLVKNGRL